ncbi:MAG: enoyl-CoA hydratase [Dehalococcoidia bacterium]|nr:enoyl-CoA hydratase [Dehalococcoidia bacterium]
MEYQDIIYEVEDATAVITLNRPEKLNAWTSTMERELRDAFKRTDADQGVRSVILTGAGRGFCAGADMGLLNTIADAGGQDERAVEPESGGIEDNYRQTFTFPLTTRKPLIAAVNGPAAGLGLIISLYCDMRFASDRARFGTAFAPLGLVAEHGVSWTLPRAVGIGNALDLLYSGRVVGADEALQMGLVQRVYPHDELLTQTKEYTAYLARRSSPQAMRVMKKLVWDAQFQDLAGATKAANAAMAQSVASPDFKEGLNAFAEKRDPRYPGLSV